MPFVSACFIHYSLYITVPENLQKGKRQLGAVQVRKYSCRIFNLSPRSGYKLISLLGILT